MKRASVDLGTNTCLLLISEWDPSRREVTGIHEDVATVVRLGEGVDVNRCLGEEPMRRTLDCLRGYSAKIRHAGIEPSAAVCVATSQARDAVNGAEFFARVKSETSLPFRVLSGGEEARCTFVGGLLPGMDPGRSAVIDIGGGSTELMSSSGGRSLDVGAVRFTERHFRSRGGDHLGTSGAPVTDEQFWACQEAIDTQLEVMTGWRDGLTSETRLVAVAGTATTLAAWHLGLGAFDAARIDGIVLTRGDLHRMVEELKWRSVSERRALPGMEPGREDVILAGAMILWRSLEVLRFADCVVSTRGLRFGVLLLA